jgi:7-carboxy-7-deazaguanine synthase
MKRGKKRLPGCRTLTRLGAGDKWTLMSDAETSAFPPLNGTDPIEVSELFLSVQGEGCTQGRRAVFVRFPRCNLRCLCCDTKYTWNKGDEETPVQTKTVDEVVEAIRGHNCMRIVFTGGEPLLPVNLKAIRSIMSRLTDCVFEIETNGTLAVPPIELGVWAAQGNVLLNVSPKGNVPQEKADEGTQIAKVVPLLRQLSDASYANYIVKVLVKDHLDLAYASMIQQTYHVAPARIYIQPMGEDTDTLVKTATKYFNVIMQKGWNISPRLHIFLFGKKRGV